VSGGLLSARPKTVIVLPVLYEGHVKAVVELASLGDFTASHLTFLEQLTSSIIGVVLNTIEATMRTEGLLKQSQQLAGELQAQQTELQQTNEELANKAKLLAEQKRGGGAQEPGNRARAARPGGKGGGAGAHFALQVGIPGQHVARAAHGRSTAS